MISGPPEGGAAATRDRLRRALANRAAQRRDLRARRAERLDRIRACTAEADPRALPAPREAEVPAVPVPAAAAGLVRRRAGPSPAGIVSIPRPRPEACPPDGAATLASLPGAGPGLVAALIQAGVPDLGTVAALGPAGLAARLGPLGRLIDVGVWVAHARRGADGPQA